MNLSMSPKRQFKMQLEDDQIDRLKVAAARLGRDTAQEVAEEILTVYFPVWLAVADSARRAVDFQTRKILESGRKSRLEASDSNIETEPDRTIIRIPAVELTDETKVKKPIKRKMVK